MRITKRHLIRIIRESYYAHDYAEEERQSEPTMGSFPHNWDQRQMDDWDQGFQDAKDNKGSKFAGVSGEYMAGYEEGMGQKR